MKSSTKLSIFGLIICLTLTGCASVNPQSFLGTNVADLVKAKRTGKVKTFDMSYNEAFDKVTNILNENKYVVFQSSSKKGFIVIMGLPQQTDTTRVGIFFEKTSDGQTKITLSSLSSTALEKAASIIFSEMDPGVEVIK